jgi:tetratricopeptide (TPR) repeat protein
MTRFKENIKKKQEETLGMKGFKRFYVILLAAYLFYAIPCHANSLSNNSAESEVVACNNEDVAIELYTKSINSNQLSKANLSEAFYGRGINRFIKGDLAFAIADFTKGVELNPSNAENYFGRGITWHEKGDYDSAISDFKKGIELDPKNLDNYIGIGLAWHSKGNYDLAIVYFTKGIDQNPKYADNYIGRGSAWREKGDHDRAIADFSKAIELGFEHDFVNRMRAELWEAKGQVDLAHRGLPPND